ncbi:MAG: hypothetical protein V1770_01480 [bacterium]
MKKLISISIFLTTLLIPFLGITLGESNVYYQTGDYFEYAEKQMLAVPNGREVELIEITRDDRFSKYQEFKTLGEPTNIIVKKDDGGFTAVTLEKDIIASYDFNDLNNIRVKNKREQCNDFYYDISPYKKDNFLTAGEKGISIWKTENLENIEKIYDKASYGVSGYNNSIYALTDEGAFILNAERKKVKDNYMKIGDHLHKVYVDENGRGFFPGDDVIKFRTASEYKNLSHPSGAGNAVSGFADDNYVYFVNGWSIYKLDKDFNIIAKANTSLENGNWSAGILSADLPQGRRLAVFNGNNLLLFDERLNLLDKYCYMPFSTKILSEKTMRVNPRHGSTGLPVFISGSGFWSGEEVNVIFAGEKYILQANNKGEAFKMVEIPKMLPGKANILMRGLNSGIEHGFWFTIE